MSKWSLVGAWFVVALIASTLTWQIVSAAAAQVSDRPVALQVDAPIIAGEVTSTGSTVAASSTTGGSLSSSSSASTPTSTSDSPSATETAWKVETIETGGGTVVVSYRQGEVVLQSAAPKPGFAAELKKSGPPDVEVEFESDSAKHEVKAEWSDGQLAVEIDQDTDD